MESSETVDSMFTWSITSPRGSKLSISLPKVVRTFEDFIKVDVYTGDSDPVYWAVYKSRSQLGEDWATRFCVAMLAHYHMGTACTAADLSGAAFWDYIVGGFGKVPHGTERKIMHMPGGRAVLESMARWSPNPEEFFTRMPRTYPGIKGTCERFLDGFGPYFQLKLIDYMDSCMGLKVTDMDCLASNLPSAPARALKIMFPSEAVPSSFIRLCKSLEGKNILAAPGFYREVGPAEVETSLCGWKTTKFKGNWFGADIAEKRAQLYAIGTERAKQLISWMPNPVSKSQFKLEL